MERVRKYNTGTTAFNLRISAKYRARIEKMSKEEDMSMSDVVWRDITRGMADPVIKEVEVTKEIEVIKEVEVIKKIPTGNVDFRDSLNLAQLLKYILSEKAPEIAHNKDFREGVASLKRIVKAGVSVPSKDKKA